MRGTTLRTAPFDVQVEGASVLRFLPAEGRVRLGLVMPSIDRVVDVSVAPSTAVARLDDAARRAGVAPQAAHRAARRSLEGAAERAGAWRPPGGVGLLTAMGGVAFPLLGAAYERGAKALDEVPRWAAAALAAPTARAAAEVAFGAGATRPLVAALASAVVTTVDAAPGPIGLWPLGLAMIGAGALDPDRLARVLREAAASPPPTEVLSVDEVCTGRIVMAALGPDPAMSVLLEATRPPAGRTQLCDLLALWPVVGHRLPLRRPSRLPALLDLCRSVAASDRHPSAHRPVGTPNARSQVHGRPPPDASEEWPGGAGGPTTATPSPRAAAARARRDASRGTAGGAATAPRPNRRSESGTGSITPVAAPLTGFRVDDRRPWTPVDRPQQIRRALDAPAAPGPARAPQAGALPLPRFLASVDGAEVGGVKLALPRSVAELERWSRRLRNCLDTYGPAVATGASHLLGVFVDGELRGCVELAPNREVRQALGPANRPLGPVKRQAVMGLLVERQVIDPLRLGNRPWLAPDDRP